MSSESIKTKLNIVETVEDTLKLIAVKWKSIFISLAQFSLIVTLFTISFMHFLYLFMETIYFTGFYKFVYGFIISPFCILAFSNISLKLLNGKKISILDFLVKPKAIWNCSFFFILLSQLKNFLEVFNINLNAHPYSFLILSIGIPLFVIISIRISFFNLYSLDQDLNLFLALNKSWNLTKGSVGKIFLIILLTVVILLILSLSIFLFPYLITTTLLDFNPFSISPLHGIIIYLQNLLTFTFSFIVTLTLSNVYRFLSNNEMQSV